MQLYQNQTLLINVSTGKINSSQRNNEYVHRNSSGQIDVSASTMCNFTSLVMAAEYNGWTLPTGNFRQPEDNFAAFTMNSVDVDLFYKTKMPSLYADYKMEKLDENGKIAYYTPNEVHAVLAYAFNLWVGCTNADTFKTNVKLDEILEHLLQNRALVLSGIFNGLGHVVTLVGCEFDVKTPEVFNVESALKFIKENNLRPKNWIIDDPYGNYHNGYTPGQSGNDIKVPHADFVKMIKPCGDNLAKWAHIIQNGAAVI